jgi:hypothetical protein
MPDLDRVKLIAQRFSLDIIYSCGNLTIDAAEYVTDNLKAWVKNYPDKIEKAL